MGVFFVTLSRAPGETNSIAEGTPKRSNISSRLTLLNYSISYLPCPRLSCESSVSVLSVGFGLLDSLTCEMYFLLFHKGQFIQFVSVYVDSFKYFSSL